jgi:hypothetical protein
MHSSAKQESRNILRFQLLMYDEETHRSYDSIFNIPTDGRDGL